MDRRGAATLGKITLMLRGSGQLLVQLEFCCPVIPVPLELWARAEKQPSFHRGEGASPGAGSQRLIALRDVKSQAGHRRPDPARVALAAP